MTASFTADRMFDRVKLGALVIAGLIILVIYWAANR